MRSLATIGSWAQLKSSSPPTTQEMTDEMRKAESEGERHKEKKKKTKDGTAKEKKKKDGTVKEKKKPATKRARKKRTALGQSGSLSRVRRPKLRGSLPPASKLVTFLQVQRSPRLWCQRSIPSSV
jgi:hypothetical protein